MADAESEYQRLQAAWAHARSAVRMTRGRLYRNERRALREFLDYVDGELLTGTMLDPRTTWVGLELPYPDQTMDDLDQEFLIEFAAEEFPAGPPMTRQGQDYDPCGAIAATWRCNLRKRHQGPHMAKGSEWLFAMWPREGEAKK